MAPVTIEHLDDDVKEIRSDIKDLSKQIHEVSVSVAKLNTKFAVVGSLGGLLAGGFGVALVLGAVGGSNRLAALEAEVHTSNQNFDRRLGEMRESISRHQIDPVPDLDDRIRRIADDLIRRASVNAMTPFPESQPTPARYRPPSEGGPPGGPEPIISVPRGEKDTLPPQQDRGNGEKPQRENGGTTPK